MGFWNWLFGRNDPTPDAPASQPAPIFEDVPGNPLGVRYVDLLQNLQLSSFSEDPEVAARALSWRPGDQDRLDFAREGDGVPCSLRFPVGPDLPPGLLFIPTRMEDKFVIGWDGQSLAFARSWSGQTHLTASARIEDGFLHIDRVFEREAAPLSFGGPVDAVDWLLRTHALDNRLPFPVDDTELELIATAPTLAMTTFGHRMTAAAVGYPAPEPSGLLASDGDLVWAIHQGDLDALTRLGSELAWRTPVRWRLGPPLMLAAGLGQAEVVERVLALGSPVDLPDPTGGTALQVAIVERTWEEVGALLLAAGADPDHANIDGFTAVHAACEVDDPEALRWLAGAGADLSAPTEAGLHPIHICAGLGHRAAAQALLENGVDPHVEAGGRSAIQIARDEGHTDLAERLAR